MYDYGCRCGNLATVFKRIANLDLPQHCARCGALMERMVAAPRVLGDYEGYDCPITGRRIEGRAAHRENLARHGCRVLEAGEREQADRNRRRAHDKLMDTIGDEVDRQIAGMSSEKRDALASDVEHFDLSVTRT